MRMNKIRFFVLLLLFSSCGVKQPVERGAEQDFGSIAVFSSPPGALILLDGVSTSRTTPDTLENIPLGPHIIRATLEEFISEPESVFVDVKKNTLHSVEFSLVKIRRIGAVAVASMPAGAEIFVDARPTGLLTPDTLQLQAGPHSISLRKNGFIDSSLTVQVVQDSLISVALDMEVRRRVLLEAFANVSCLPCIEAAHNLHLFRQDTPEDDFAIIEYYANWPSPNDPFYKAAPQDVMQRVMYYKLTTLPALRIAGVSGVDATRYEDIDNAFNAAYAAQTAQTAISLDRQLRDGELLVDVHVYQLTPLQDVEQMRLFVAVVEDGIRFDEPPGSNGLKDFDFVFRGFVGDRRGEPLTGDEQQSFHYTAAWGNFNYANSYLVAFIQNIATGKIIQSTVN